MLEAINICEEITGRRLNWTYQEANRIGDHIWWISDITKFKAHYPKWDLTYNVRDILNEIHSQNAARWPRASL
jgi:CDP-paratose 2-epimerase